MQTIRWNIQIILLSLVLMSLVCACSLAKTKYYSLSGIDKSMIPYQIGDTVRYVDDKGDLVTLVASEIQEEWVPGEENEFTGKLHDVTEYRRVFLRSEQGASLFIQIEGGGEPRRLLRAVGLNSRSTLAYAVLYDSKGDFVEEVEWDNEVFAHKYYVYDKIWLNNHVYHDVAMYYGRHSHYKDTIQFYYNKSHGVLQMTENGKTLFTLDTVIFAGAR